MAYFDNQSNRNGNKKVLLCLYTEYLTITFFKCLSKNMKRTTYIAFIILLLELLGIR